VHERVKEEIDLLKRQFPKLEHGEKLDWVLLPDMALPDGRFNRATTPVMFLVPASYPQCGPDNFFVDLGLRLKDGANPPAFNANGQSSTGPAPVAGQWGWFSWHPQAWRPAATVEGGDNLLGFVRGINVCLRGEESG